MSFSNNNLNLKLFQNFNSGKKIEYFSVFILINKFGFGVRNSFEKDNSWDVGSI